jgi:two-component system OmpR family sensor kinase
VFAAILLVVVVVAAVMAFSLSMFAIMSREAMDAVAREAPYEAAVEVARSGSLPAAAVHIVESLVRPGISVGVGVFQKNGLHRGFLAVALAEPGRNGRPLVWRPGIGGFDGPPLPGSPGRSGYPGLGVPRPGGGPGNPGLDGPPGESGTGRRGLDRMPPPYPYGLGPFLHIEPRNVVIQGGFIRIVPDPAPLERTTRDFLLAMLPIGLFVVVGAWLAGRFITGQALRPLVETTASLNRFGAGDFTPRLVVTADRNEIGELVKAYNSAAAQVTAAFEERRVAETNMRQFIADAGHELRTPLTVIMGFIDVLRRRALSESARTGGVAISAKIYETMLAESRRMKALIDKLVVLARLENVAERELETVDLGEVSGQVVAALQVLEERPRIALQSEAGAIVRGRESELHDAISNLVENALKYAPDSPVDVRVGSEAGDAVVCVSDRGPGIPADEHERIFTRFYRGRERVEADGFGLGLAIAKRAVERAGGELAVESTPGVGSSFTMRIPRATRGEAVAVAV